MPRLHLPESSRFFSPQPGLLGAPARPPRWRVAPGGGGNARRRGFTIMPRALASTPQDRSLHRHRVRAAANTKINCERERRAVTRRWHVHRTGARRRGPTRRAPPPTSPQKTARPAMVNVAAARTRFRSEPFYDSQHPYVHVIGRRCRSRPTLAPADDPGRWSGTRRTPAATSTAGIIAAGSTSTSAPRGSAARRR